MVSAELYDVSLFIYLFSPEIKLTHISLQILEVVKSERQVSSTRLIIQGSDFSISISSQFDHLNNYVSILFGSADSYHLRRRTWLVVFMKILAECSGFVLVNTASLLKGLS